MSDAPQNEQLSDDILNQALRQSNRLAAERLVPFAVHIHPDTIVVLHSTYMHGELPPSKLHMLEMLNMRVIPDTNQPRNSVTVTAVLRKESDRE